MSQEESTEERRDGGAEGPRGDAGGSISEGSRSGARGGREAGREAEGDEDPGVLTLPNLLSLSRVPLGLSFLAVDAEVVLAAIVAAGAVTDLLDGFVARVSDSQSGVGVVLDPFCDKFFVLIGLISFLPGGHLDWAGFLVLILRDIFTGGTYLLGRLVGRRVPFRSRLGGKLTTGLQLCALFSLIFGPRYVPLLLVLVAAASLYAIVDYGTAGIRHWQRQRRRAAA